MIQPEDIITIMGQQAKTVCTKVYPQERPNATTEKLTQFIVVSLPYSMVNKTIEEDDDWWVDMTVVFDIYVADKKKASNPREMNIQTIKTLRENLLGVFPIIDREHGLKITRPRTVINFSSDGEGYHYTRIQAKMSTMY